MRVILKQDIENLGRKGDIVNVAAGYGRNYLIPKKIALKLTRSNMKMIEIERQALMMKVEKERSSYQGLIEKLNQTKLVFQRKTGEKDVIFGSVSSSDIKEALDELGFEIDKKKIVLEEPIKRLGNYTVQVKIYHEDRAEIGIELVKEEEIEEKKKEGEKEEAQREKKIEEVGAIEAKPEEKEQKEKEVKAKEETKKEEAKEEKKKAVKKAKTKPKGEEKEKGKTQKEKRGKKEEKEKKETKKK